MKKLIFSTLVICLVVAFSSTSTHALEFSFNNSGDHFSGEVTVNYGIYYTLGMQETGFNRATYGSAFVEGNTVYIGVTKNTSVATTSWRIEIDLTTLTGPYNVVVTFGSGAITETTGTATMGFGVSDLEASNASVAGE